MRRWWLGSIEPAGPRFKRWTAGLSPVSPVYAAVVPFVSVTEQRRRHDTAGLGSQPPLISTVDHTLHGTPEGRVAVTCASQVAAWASLALAVIALAVTYRAPIPPIPPTGHAVHTAAPRIPVGSPAFPWENSANTALIQDLPPRVGDSGYGFDLSLGQGSTTFFIKDPPPPGASTTFGHGSP